MQGDFKLMRDESNHVGTFTIDSDNDIWLYKALSLEKQPLTFQLCIKESNSLDISGLVVRRWIEDRAPEPNYEFIGALLQRVGIKEYDPLAFVMYNKGHFNTDTFYLEEI